MVHIDIYNASKVRSLGHNKYIFTFIDDYIYIKFLRFLISLENSKFLLKDKVVVLLKYWELTKEGSSPPMNFIIIAKVGVFDNSWQLVIHLSKMI